MLYRASVLDVRQGRITRRYGHLAVVMQHYPRFLGRELIDEYLRSLAPERALFSEFKARARATGDHNAAFAEVRYEARFVLTAESWEHLERLSGAARERDVYLICQCGPLERCHGDLLLLAARVRCGARTASVRFSYPVFESRLAEGSTGEVSP